MGQEAEENGKAQLARYGDERWNAARVDKEIASVADWGAKHKVPVWCGEFGVYKTYAEPTARAAWLHDMRVAFEAHKVGWSMWDYQGGFALVLKANGTTAVDASVVEALGLKTAR
jgi:endoglucanase